MLILLLPLYFYFYPLFFFFSRSYHDNRVFVAQPSPCPYQTILSVLKHDSIRLQRYLCIRSDKSFHVEHLVSCDFFYFFLYFILIRRIGIERNGTSDFGFAVSLQMAETANAQAKQIPSPLTVPNLNLLYKHKRCTLRFCQTLDRPEKSGFIR